MFGESRILVGVAGGVLVKLDPLRRFSFNRSFIRNSRCYGVGTVLYSLLLYLMSVGNGDVVA